MRPSERRTGASRLLEPEMLVALSAVLLGVCALVVSVVQVRMMHEQQHASVWPRLVVMPSANENGLHIDVSNPGIGPAVIQYVRITVDGRPTTRWESTLDALLPERRSGEVVWSTLHDRIVPPGESIRPLHLPDPRDAAALLANAERLDMEICYCSVYERCWSIAANFTRRALPVEVASCPAPDREMFAN